MALEVRGHVVPSLHRSAKRSNLGCDVGGSDGVHGIRLSGFPKRTGHDIREGVEWMCYICDAVNRAAGSGAGGWRCEWEGLCLRVFV
jgi:hypothetical protein